MQVFVVNKTTDDFGQEMPALSVHATRPGAIQAIKDHVAEKGYTEEHIARCAKEFSFDIDDGEFYSEGMTLSIGEHELKD